MTRPAPLPPRGPASRLLSAARRLAEDESGSSTIEFVFMVPVVFAMFMSTFEMGMLLTRQVMLDRGLDMTVRLARLGEFDPITNPDARHEAMKETICQVAALIRDCMESLKLEMVQVDPRAWTTIDNNADCVDRSDPDSLAVTTFVPGTANQLMILRACALFDPFVPTVGLGIKLAEPRGYYALTSTTAFVIEPD